MSVVKRLLFLGLVLFTSLPAWAQPTAQFYKGSFTAATATGNQTISGIVDDDGTSFTPKLIMLWGTKQTAAGVVDGAFWEHSLLDCTSGKAMTNHNAVEDALATSNANHAHHNARAIDTYTHANANDSRSTLASCSSGQFVMNWSVAGSAWLYQFVAIGGSAALSDLEDVNMEGGGAELDDSGLVATASFLIVGEQAGGFIEAIQAEAPNIGMGWFTRQISSAGVQTFQQGAAAVCSSDNDAASLTSRQQYTTFVIAAQNTGCAANYMAYSWNGNYGFVATTGSGNDEPSAVAMLGGLAAKSGTGLQRTSAGTDATTIAGLGFTPKLVCVQSVGAVPNGALDVTAGRYSFGCATPDATGHIWLGEVDAVTPTVVASKYVLTDLISMGTPTATGASSTFEALANISAWGADGVTVNWSVADATARQYLWIAFGAAAPVAGGGTERSVVH